MPDVNEKNQPLADEPIMIERPNVLLERTGGGLDQTLVTRAEAAVKDISTDFPAWIAETVGKLTEARRPSRGQPLDHAARKALYTTALEAKSLGETLGYPLITRFAHSLCRLLDKWPKGGMTPAALVDAHIDSIRASLQMPPGAITDPIATKLVIEMEEQASAALAKAGA